MRILSYESRSGAEADLCYSRMHFATLNLIVGDSGTGKTRLLNTIFNCACLVTRKDQFFVGWWDITFEHRGNKYKWSIETGGGEGAEARVLNETLIHDGDTGEEVLVQRDLDSFVYLGKHLPKLAPRETSISLLQEEEVIRHIYSGFSRVMRRSFSGSDLDVSTSYQAVPQTFVKKIKKTGSLDELYSSGLNLNGKLYILSEYFKTVYDQVCREFKNVFPFVHDVKMLDAEQFGFHHPGIVPVFAIKEKFIKKWIPLNQLSSGMRKVLLILTDVFTMPADGVIYLIDEYENSLGVNAINFFPSVLLEIESGSQYVITSHHPYIIGNVPVKNWIVLHRKGNEVLVKQGTDLEQRFGKSRQEAFVQLINDPFYTQGVE